MTRLNQYSILFNEPAILNGLETKTPPLAVFYHNKIN